MNDGNNEPGEWMTVEEAARHVRLAEGTVYNKVSQRTIPFHRNGRLLRFRREELDAWLRGELAA